MIPGMRLIQGPAVDPDVMAIWSQGKPAGQGKVENSDTCFPERHGPDFPVVFFEGRLESYGKGRWKQAAFEWLGKLWQFQDVGQCSEQYVDTRARLENRIDRDPKVGLCTRQDGMHEGRGVSGMKSVDKVISPDEDDDDANFAAGDLPGQAGVLPALDHISRGGVAPRPVKREPLITRLSTAVGGVAAEVQAARPSQDLYPVLGRAAIGRVELVLIRITIAENADAEGPPIHASLAS